MSGKIIYSTICPEDQASQADINTSYSQQIDRLQDEECDNNEMTEDSLIEFENKYKQMSTDKNGNCHR
ncbi:9814_t:CDS:2, partial [Entrophospora sp. SA101]